MVDKQLLDKIHQHKFISYNEDEKKMVSSLVDFLHNNKKIKKMSYWIMSKNLLLGYIKAK